MGVPLSLELMLFHSYRTSALALALLIAGGGMPALAVAGVAPAPSASPATGGDSIVPSPGPEDPAVTHEALRQFVAWQAGNVDPSHYTAAAKAKLEPAQVESISKNLAALGAFQHAQYVGRVYLEDAPTGVQAYLYHMFCTGGAVFEEIILDGHAKVNGIVFRAKLEQ